jgi:hypothetical protein
LGRGVQQAGVDAVGDEDGAVRGRDDDGGEQAGFLDPESDGVVGRKLEHHTGKKKREGRRKKR